MEANNEIEKVKNALTIFLKKEGLRKEDYIFDCSLDNRLVIRRTLENDKRYLWITPLGKEFGYKFSLFWGFSFSAQQGLDGRRYGSLPYVLSIVKYWIVDWKDYCSIPFERIDG